MRYKLLTFLVFSMGIFVSCQKEVSETALAPVAPPTTSTSEEDKIKDSVLMNTRDIYLWYSQIPTDFNPRSYADPDKIMTAIRAFSKEPGFPNPVDRWSFAAKQKDWDNVSSGAADDFGMNVFFIKEGDLRVKYVEKASPAGIAGIRRGWRITKINGNTNITTTNSKFLVDNIYSSPGSNITFEKPDGSVVDVALKAAGYQENPIFLDSVYTAGSKKAGYVVFNSFLGDTTQIYNQFQRIFNRFSQESVNEVVIDLRYNGGGYVSVQDKLANYLINSSGNGNIMMNQQYNDKYKQFNSTTRFRKLGSLNLSRIFFIVSNGTASASELLINNLKPYLDVKVVGPSNSYGKPVGFFPIPVKDWYIFPVSFRSTNKNGEGSYFDGIKTDNKAADGLDKEWGDRSEPCLASIIRFISTGAFSRAETAGIYGAQSIAETTVPSQVRTTNEMLNPNTFKGAIATGIKF